MIKGVVYVLKQTHPITKSAQSEDFLTTTPDLLQSALAVTTALIYVGAAARQLLTLDGRRHRAPWDVTALAVLAVSCHLAIFLLDLEKGVLDLGFYKISSLIFLVMGMITVVSLLVRPLQMVIIATFPFSALAVLVSAFAPPTGQPLAGLESGLLAHIVSSLLAFGVLTLTSLQGALLSVQTQLLRSHNTRGIVRLLPALDTMGQMFFELLAAGVLWLTVAVVSGGLFVDDLLGQQLVHKTVLTTLSWALLTMTLVVHWQRGLRISTALSLVFLGYGLMAIGFFGSKLVVELLL